MPVLLTVLLITLLLHPAEVMNAASAACGLFVRSVMPGLLPYMILSQMLVSRIRQMKPVLIVLLGWGGGSPAGGRLLGLCPGLDARRRAELAVCCSTMSPMFLLGTVGAWLGFPSAGTCALGAVLAGGWIAGRLAGRVPRRADDSAMTKPPTPLTLGEAADQTARTLLTVCATMALMRVLAELAAGAVAGISPALRLVLLTLMEVSGGAAEIAALPLPLPLRTALIAGAAGFGGAAILLQNRSVWPRGLMSLLEQLLWQAVHGAASFLIALGLMQLYP